MLLRRLSIRIGEIYVKSLQINVTNMNEGI